MERKIIKPNIMAEVEMAEILQESTARLKKRKVEVILTGRQNVKIEGLEEIPAPLFKSKVSEQQLAQALKSTLGNHSAAAKLLHLSQSAVSQRVGKSKYLQNIIMQTRELFVDKAENIIKTKLDAENFEAALVVIQRLGWMRGWIKKDKLDIDVPRGGGVLP